jgi:hypothetical protein
MFFPLRLGIIGIGIILVIGFVALKIVARLVGGSPGVGLFKILGVAAILSGVALFWARSDHHEVLVHGPHSIAVEAPFWDRGPSDWGDGAWDLRPAIPKEWRVSSGPKVWMILSGTLLIIVGALLFGRERTRPVAFKAFTWLGLAAVVFSLVSFFGTPPRDLSHPPIPAFSHRDRVIKLDKVDALSEPARPAAPRATKTKRVARAKRPASRPERSTEADDAIEQLPARAGEIPVAAELAKTDARPATPEPATAATPPTLAPAPAAVQTPTASQPAVAANQPAEPAKPVEAAKSVEASTPVEPAKAVEPAKPAEPPVGPPAEASPPAKSAGAIAPAETSGTRPAWVDAPAKLADSVYTMPVSSGLIVSVPECQRELDHEIKRETDHYIDEYLGEHASSLVDIPLAYLKAHVKKAEFGELVLSESVGPMHQIHARLEFDDNARADFHRLWHNAVVTDRLWVVGSGAALVLALLGTFYGFLKLDLRTGGAHTGRLQLAATLVALIVAAGALLMRWAVPF